MIKTVIKILVGVICMIAGVIIIVSIFASFSNCPIKSIAWNNVTDEYKVYLKIKDVKEADELFNILRNKKVSRKKTEEDTYTIYDDITIKIMDNKVSEISSVNMQAIYDMEKENAKNASIEYNGDVEILSYHDKHFNDVVRVGNNEYWAYKANIFTFALSVIIFLVGIVLVITTVFNNF